MTTDKQKRHSYEWVDGDLYVLFDGVKVAVREKPISGHFGCWISIEPGFEVFDTSNCTGIVIRQTACAFTDGRLKRGAAPIPSGLTLRPIDAAKEARRNRNKVSEPQGR